MFDLSLHLQCSILAECFVLSGKDNWDSQSFVDQLFTTEWRQNILKVRSIHEMYFGLVDTYHVR